MTEIEEKFFEVFKVDNCSNCGERKSLECYYCDSKYPQITSDILLEIIALINTYDDRLLFKKTKEELKEEILKLAIETGTNKGVVNYKQFKQQVKSLFKKGEQ